MSYEQEEPAALTCGRCERLVVGVHPFPGTRQCQRQTCGEYVKVGGFLRRLLTALKGQ
jgi:hypothetical protein